MRLPASTAIKIQTAVCAGGALACLRIGAAGGRAHSVRQAVHTAAIDTSAAGDHQPDRTPTACLVALAYELLDAHADTAQLADDLRYDRSWAAHLDYLRALQRKGRETLARTASEELSSCHSDGMGSPDVR
jgi:hypothetical protein